MDLDLEGIRRDLDGLPGPPPVFYPAEEDSPFAARFAEFVGHLKHEAGLAVVERATDPPGPGIRPALTLSSRDGRTLHYLALPDGPEAAPFAEALRGLGRGKPESREDWRGQLADMAEPAELFVFVAAGCPHCPGAVREALQVTLASSMVTTSVIDAAQYADLGARFGVQAVPMTVIDGGLSLTGVVPAGELVGHILARGRADYEARRFRSIVESGRLEVATREILAGPGAALWLEAWRRSSTSLRMGLLLAAEQALEENPAALDPVVAELLVVLGEEDAALRGDTADVLGRIGHPAAGGALEKLRHDPNPDVAEIAAEALEELRSARRQP